MTGQQDLLGKDLYEKDLLEKGFELAYFILPDRAAALQIVTEAMNKLKLQRGRESRRAYWRDKHLKRGITRITRNEQDALQWLVFYQADQYQVDQNQVDQHEAGQYEADQPAGERHQADQERGQREANVLKSGQLATEQRKADGLTANPQESLLEGPRKNTARDVVVRYITTLVRMTTAMSSFHVNIGLHRLLHNYSTVETQRVYETITERYLGADEYRRAKSVLMAKLAKRFGGLLKTVRGQHGEMRFEAEEDQAQWAPLVDICLKMFTPWSTNQSCPVPGNYDASSQKPPARLSGKGPDRVDPNEIEINRCHAFIHPACYGRLMHALTFDAPGSRLALPRFFMDTDKSDHSSSSPQTPRLSPEERKQITDQLSSRAKKRSEADPRMATLLVDGVECARIGLEQSSECSFAIEEGAELMELRSRYQGEDLLLAVHHVLYQGTEGFATSQLTMYRKGLRKLDLSIVPGPATMEGPRHALVSLRYTPNPLVRLWQPAAPGMRRSGAGYAAGALALVGLGWVLGIATQHRYFAPQRLASNSLPTVAITESSATPIRQEVQPAVRPGTQPEIQPQVQAVREASARISYTLVPDDMIVRSSGTADIPSVAVPAQPTLLSMQLPVAPEHARKSFRASLKSFVRPGEILRENMLTVKNTPTGHVVVFSLPSVFIEDRQDYTVDLRAVGSGGEVEEINSYTFHVEKKP